MSLSNTTTLAEQLAEVLRETTDIRRLCNEQRKQLAEQFDRLQAIRRAMRYVENSLEASRIDLWEVHGRRGSH